ncbi:hypothetical protein MMC30_003468 [Trapelia coarctata]|nr:hypothetical protein [Trapelia coarctata]
MPLNHGLNPYSNFPAPKKELEPLRMPALLDKLVSGSKASAAEGPERGAYEKMRDGEEGKKGGKK